MKTYTLVLDGITAPGGNSWNEFGEKIMVTPDNGAFMEGHAFDDFLCVNCEDFIDNLKDRLRHSFDTISKLVFSNITAVEPVSEDFDPEVHGDHNEYLPWPSKTSWRGTIQLQVRDPDMVPLLREMIRYIGKLNQENGATGFHLVSMEPVSQPAGKVGTSPLAAQMIQARDELHELMHELDELENSNAFRRADHAETALYPGMTVTVTWDDEETVAESPDDILYGSINR